VLLIIWSQYRYYELISKIFQPNKVATKIYILPCAHILFKINMYFIQITPLQDQQLPPGQVHSTFWETLLYIISRHSFNSENVMSPTIEHLVVSPPQYVGNRPNTNIRDYCDVWMRATIKITFHFLHSFFLLRKETIFHG
jgi:hypothetical protein